MWLELWAYGKYRYILFTLHNTYKYIIIYKHKHLTRSGNIKQENKLLTRLIKNEMPERGCLVSRVVVEKWGERCCRQKENCDDRCVLLYSFLIGRSAKIFSLKSTGGRTDVFSRGRIEKRRDAILRKTIQ